MSITGTGNVGIGTVTPTERLDVTGNIKVSGAIMPNNLPGTAGQVLTSAGAGVAPTWTTVASNNLYTVDGTLAGARTVTQGANNLTFSGTGNVLLTSGNVGVGISTPTEKLDVTGNVKFSNALMPNNLPGTAGQVLTSAGAGVAPTWTTVASNNLYTADGTLAGARTVTQGANNLTFSGTGNVLLTSGNVGVGTSTPTSSLAINGSISQAVLSVSSSVTLSNTDNIVVCDATTAGLTVTLPTVSTCNGRIYTIKKIDTTNNALTFSVAIKSSPTETFTSLNYQKTLKIQSDGTNWWLIN
jgi:hypothetical protein